MQSSCRQGSVGSEIGESTAFSLPSVAELIVKSCQGLKCLKIRGKSSVCVSQHVGGATEGEAGEVGWPSVRNTGRKCRGRGY